MINIGTNFEYQGDLFLDGRQGYPQTTDDLLNWSIPIPEGFEVYLNGVWYVYDPAVNDPVIGHFKRRIDFDYPGSEVQDVIDYILDIISRGINALSFGSFITNPPPDEVGGLVTTLEVGSSPINLSINWTLRKGNQVVTPTDALVNLSPIGVASNFLSYSQNSITSLNVPGSIPFVVRVYNNNDFVERTYRIDYKYKKYWGVSSNTSITSNEILSNFIYTWAGSWMMGTTFFDCSGGKYPYYVIPEMDYVESIFTLSVNGMVNSDIVVQSVTINGVPYKVIRTGNIQTGILRISYEI